MERIGIYRVEPINDICEGAILWYDEPAFRHNRYRNANRDGENRNTAVVRATSKDGKKVVLEILDSVGTNPKARGAKSYKKPSDLLKSSTRRTMKTEWGLAGLPHVYIRVPVIRVQPTVASGFVRHSLNGNCGISASLGSVGK